MSVSRRLVLVSSSFPIRNDGSEAAGSFVADIVEELARSAPVHVVAPGNQTACESWGRGIQVWRFAAPARPLSTLKPWHVRDLRWILRVWQGGLRATRSACANADHVVALWGLPCGEWARRVARANGIGYSVWLLGSDVWTLGRVPILRGMLARVIRQAANAYADGLALAEDAQKIGKTPVAFLPSTRSIAMENPRPPRDRSPYRLLFLGRWHVNKGVDLLLEAIGMLNDADWRNIECVEIQGGGPLEALVRERVEKLRAAGRPVEAGHFLAKSDAEAAIGRADWVLIPSRIESIPVVFSDAMKLRRPIIATPAGDLPRLIRKFGCGVLCPAASAGGLVEGIRQAISGASEIMPGSLESASRDFSLSGAAQRLLDDIAR